MIAAENRFVPHRAVAASELVLTETTLAVRNAPIELAAVVLVTGEAVLLASTTAADRRIRCLRGGRHWSGRRLGAASRRRCRGWRCRGCRARSVPIAVDLVQRLIGGAAAFGSTRVGRMHAHAQLRRVNGARSAREFECRQLGGLLVDAPIEDRAVVLVRVVTFGRAGIVGQSALLF